MKKTIAMLLAGGAGSRLNTLAQLRAKPAVPFGGVYRIIDFTMSNIMHSSLNHVGILTQYRPFSLIRHIGIGAPWGLVGRTRSAKILPPSTGKKNSDWYRGTADAIAQNLDYIERQNPERVLVLSGDHIYRMNYVPMVDFHKVHQADVTIAIMKVPWEYTRHFGTAIVDSEFRIIGWEEKPEKARSNLVSMGVYVFSAQFLYDILNRENMTDFGKDIIPVALSEARVFAYPFDGYWADVGTLRAYWNANMDILRKDSGLELDKWDIRTNVEEEGMLGDRYPTFIGSHAIVKDSIISPGCVVEGKVQHSIISPGVRVEKDAQVRDCVIMHDTVIGAHSYLNEVIIDKCVRIGDKCRIGFGDAKQPNKKFPTHAYTGLTVVGKWAEIPPGTTIGRNTIVQSDVKALDFSGKNITTGDFIEAHGTDATTGIA